jgi:hypothetical protein
MKISRGSESQIWLKEHYGRIVKTGRTCPIAAYDKPLQINELRSPLPSAHTGRRLAALSVVLPRPGAGRTASMIAKVITRDRWPCF